MKRERKKNMVSFRMTDTENKRLNELVKRNNGHSRSEFIRSMILFDLSTAENYMLSCLSRKI